MESQFAPPQPINISGPSHLTMPPPAPPQQIPIQPQQIPIQTQQPIPQTQSIPPQMPQAQPIPPPIPPPTTQGHLQPLGQNQSQDAQKSLQKINMNFGYSLKLEQESFFESTLLTPMNKIILSFMLKRNHYDYGDDEFVEKRSIITRLIYKASVDGDDSVTFHRKCDNQGSTVTIIRTDNGRTFGGFTKFNWDYNIHETQDKCEDRNCFIFSLDTREKIIEFDSFHFPSYKDCGPCFLGNSSGNPTLLISNGCQRNNGSFIAFGRMNNGSQNFTVVDYEVFTVFIF